MQIAEHYAKPVFGKLGGYFQRINDFKDTFSLRWGRIEFDMHHGMSANLKVILKVYRDSICETFIVDTDAFDIEWDRHKRATRDFFVHPYSSHFGKINCIKFSFIVHLGEHSIASRHEYIFMDWHQLQDGHHQQRTITDEHATPNYFRTYELNPAELQADVDWYNHHFDSLHLIPKFTKGQQYHPYHPKRFIHDHIDKVIMVKRDNPNRLCTIKVSVDCIDDNDFINHLIHASHQGVWVQCIVDWRKMTLTNSHTYANLKRSGIELIGVFCTPKHHLIEVEPDMHTKFIIFNDEDAILGSFNITFDRWWANWESGMTFHSKGVCRLLDNIFQSQRGGVIQKYGIDPLSPFNLLYTFGRHTMANGKIYRPHHAILAEIHRARHSIKLCLFLIGELVGDHHDSVVTALIQAKERGVDVRILFNGHLARQGRIGVERPMHEELNRPLLPAVQRLRWAGIPVGLVYGQDDHPVPYSPIHSKYCVIDDYIVIEGSFNWYNTSVFSHDLVVVAANHDVARPYLYEFDQIQRAFRVFY
ncbi:phospholipase D-like domain-containing protein [Methylomonas rapida]|uniref:phospholipase D n=1 Tax=Methylomonas rapida TaxID=2963939 RepID=A0ABY7GIN2_9GAMM|nr:phospholipase D-like domain-containing protein [Methylomonas rapida]WAR44171.1 phospholipase D-like domain-containing protein [Methylomonas rapida]